MAPLGVSGLDTHSPPFCAGVGERGPSVALECGSEAEVLHLRGGGVRCHVTRGGVGS